MAVQRNANSTVSCFAGAGVPLLHVSDYAVYRDLTVQNKHVRFSFSQGENVDMLYAQQLNTKDL